MQQLQQPTTKPLNTRKINVVKTALIAKVAIASTLCANVSYAEILSDTTTRRTVPKLHTTSSSSSQTINGSDKLAALIQKKSKEYQKNADAFYRSQQQNSHTYHNYSQNSYSGSGSHSGHQHYSGGSDWEIETNFNRWINSYYNKQRANEYKQFLQQRVGSKNVPPLPQMLLTARSWQSCGAEQFSVPPKYLWSNMVSTLYLLAELKRQGVIPQDISIRSVYRSPGLNRCARGAPGSKHKLNAAMDLWMPQFNYDTWYRYDIQDKLCEFWLYQGQKYNFGLGIYSSGAIHIDTQGYRKWGISHSSRNSPCRY